MFANKASMALLTPLMLQKQGLAQLPMFEFKSEASRMQQASECSKGYLPSGI